MCVCLKHKYKCNVHYNNTSIIIILPINIFTIISFYIWDSAKIYATVRIKTSYKKQCEYIIIIIRAFCGLSWFDGVTQTCLHILLNLHDNLFCYLSLCFD